MTARHDTNMNSLKIPEGGVTLKGSPDEGSDPLPQQAFTISLNDSVIEGMIKCVQNGGDIQLALGADPVSFDHSNNSSHLCREPLPACEASNSFCPSKC